MTRRLLQLPALAAACCVLLGCSLDFDKFGGMHAGDGGSSDSSDAGHVEAGTHPPFDAGLDAMSMHCSGAACTAHDGSTPREAAVMEPSDAQTMDGSSGDAGDAATEVCTSDDDSCSDSSTLKACRSDHGGFDTSPCLAGCSTTGTPHCKQLYPTAPVTSADFTVQGSTSVMAAAGDTLLNTDTGQITGMVTRDANLISTEVKVVSGIAFHQTGDGYGVFSFGELTIASGATFKLIGSNAAVIVSTGNLFVYGTIDARPMDASGALCPAARVAGPGAAAGGAAGYPGPSPTSGAPGAGPGAGQGGTLGIQGNPGGGGGAGHSATGGHGGAGCHTGSPANGGGTGGAPYSSESPGGSGGGGGGSADGGGGGGGVRLVAAGVIRIGDGTAAAGVNAGGCGGKGGLGGGGGGSGGSIVLEAPFIEVTATGTLAANGGGGGGQSSSTNYDGAPGGLDAKPAYGAASSMFGSVAGNGGAGDAPAGTDAIMACGSTEGEGGGGAAGSIQLLAHDATPTVHASAVLSPSMVSGSTTYAAADVH